MHKDDDFSQWIHTPVAGSADALGGSDLSGGVGLHGVGSDLRGGLGDSLIVESSASASPDRHDFGRFSSMGLDDPQESGFGWSGAIRSDIGMMQQANMGAVVDSPRSDHRSPLHRYDAGGDYQAHHHRPAFHRSLTMPAAGRHGTLPHGGRVRPTQGWYLVKFAVGVTAFYFAVQLLISFAEVVLPFLFAMLLLAILEPLKQFIMRVFQQLIVAGSKKCCLILIEKKMHVDHDVLAPGGEGAAADYGQVPVHSDVDSPANNLSPRSRSTYVPLPAVQKVVLVTSIVLCLTLTGRAIYIIARVFISSGMTISGDVEYYQQGAVRIKDWLQLHIRHLPLHDEDWESLVDQLIEWMKYIGKMATINVFNVMVNTVVTLIFLLYMLWSPIKTEGSVTAQGVFKTTSHYLYTKFIIASCSGICVFVVLYAADLELAPAFSLFTVLAKFVPGFGPTVATLLSCVLGIIDVRKTVGQVVAALSGQLLVHVVFEMFLEPVVFGYSVQLHSVIIVLGISFFGQIWGIPGTLLSVPLLSVVRLLLKALRTQGRDTSVADDREDREVMTFFESMLAGKWMKGVDEEVELAELSIHHPQHNQNYSEHAYMDKRDNAGGGVWQGVTQSASRVYTDYQPLIDFVALTTVVVVLFVI